MQTSGVNSERIHCEIKRFSTVSKHFGHVMFYAAEIESGFTFKSRKNSTLGKKSYRSY